MRKFKLYSNIHKSGATYFFCKNNNLLGVVVDELANDFLLQKLLNNMPPTVQALLSWQSKSVAIVETTKEVDLSFTHFWDLYAYKVGKKTACEKLWKLLKNEDKLNCLIAIPLYNKWLTKGNIEKCYPETFLRQTRWEGDFD